MTRAAWLTAVALITGTLTAISVRALIDSRLQTPATDAQLQLNSFAAGTAYAQSPITGEGVDLTPIGSEAVPWGREFVILQVNVNVYANSSALSLMQLESRYPAPNHERSPIILERLTLANPGHTDRIFTLQFPDGSVVVDSGRMLWVSTPRIDAERGDEELSLPPVSVLGYYREKSQAR